MELFLQLGYGMKEHSRILFEQWGGGTAILSPRDQDEAAIIRCSEELRSSGGNVLIDPQLFDLGSDYTRLVQQRYWPSGRPENMLTSRESTRHLLTELLSLNNSAGTSEYILPGLYCSRVDDSWSAQHDSLVSEAADVMRDKAKLATVCLSAETVRDETQIDDVLSLVRHWPVEGIYLIAEHPHGDYLVDDPAWLANVLLLVSSLKIEGRKVVVGYSNHQMLCAAAANADAIASGTFLNVRSFPRGKFRLCESTISRRKTWYYCPQAMSEYQVPFLDMAYRAGALGLLTPDASLESPYANLLFSGAEPSTTSYTEKDSYRHYLHCLHEQASMARKETFKATLEFQFECLVRARQQVESLKAYGVFGQNRDFRDIVDVNESSLGSLGSNMGFVLERTW